MTALKSPEVKELYVDVSGKFVTPPTEPGVYRILLSDGSAWGIVVAHQYDDHDLTLTLHPHPAHFTI